MKKKILNIMLAVAVSISFMHLHGNDNAFANEIDILVRKLVDKGVLTTGEAQQVLSETKQEAKAQLAKGEAPEVPQWVQNINMKGDFRTRYQWQEKKSGTATKANDRHRARIRFRLGMDAKVNDKIKLAAGLITGSDDPRSGNQTLEKSFYTGDLRLDYAYAEYKPFDWVALAGGKVINPLWTNSSMLWSGDVRPDGLSMKMNWKAYSKFNMFLNSGLFVLDESSSYNADPIMWAIQPGFNWGITDQADLRATFNYYGFNGIKGKKLGFKRENPKTNSKDAGNNYLYTYSSFGTSGELGFKKPFGDEGIFTHIPFMSAFGEFIHNPDPKKDRNGWLIGGKIGHSRVRRPGQWQGMYNYRKLEKDAWVDFLPEANFYGGDTGVKGHEMKLQYGLLKNLNLGLAYYNTCNISGTKRKENLFQADLVFRF